MNTCPVCGKEHDGSYGSGKFCSKHCRYVYIGKQTKNHVCNFPKVKNKKPWGTWKCCWCGEVFETKSKLIDHKRLFHKKKSHPAWNKGLTKETDKRVKKARNTLVKRYKNGELVSHFKGKHWDEEHKKLFSEIRKKFLKEHPEKVPYLLNHSSKMSYHERYFNFIIMAEHINAKFHLNIEKYQLDFYNENLKKYLEIDGESHYTDKKTIQIDKERTKFLTDIGWTGMRIRWKDYQKLKFDERKNIIDQIKKYFEK